VVWDLRRELTEEELEAARRSSGGGGRGASGSRAGPGNRGGSSQSQQSQLVFSQAGLYRVVLTIDGKEYSHELTLQRDPEFPEGIALGEEEEDVEADEYRLDY
jgi:hypothetical protein